MATLATLVNEARMQNGEDDGVTSANSLIPDANFLDWAADFYNDLSRYIRVEGSSTTITLVDGTQEYSLASDFGAFIEDPYAEDTAGNRYPIKGPVPFTWDLVSNTSERGQPMYWYWVSQDPWKIGFSPTPGTGSVKYRYVKTFTVPTLTSETFAAPTLFVTPFKLYVLWQAAMRMKQFGAANGFQNEYQRAMVRAKTEWHRREYGSAVSWRQ